MVETEKEMKFNEFICKMEEAITERTGIRVQVKEVKKNNGAKLHGMMFPSKGLNIITTIYMEEYYVHYIKYGFEEAVNMLMAEYENNKPIENIDIAYFMNYDNIYPKLRLRLLNFEKNKGRLSGAPYYQFLDFAVTLSLAVTGPRNNGVAAIPVQNNHMKVWGKTKEELFRVARENMKNDYDIQSLDSVLQDIISKKDENLVLDVERKLDLYVMTNRGKFYGASALLAQGALKDFAEKEKAKEVVILPSSIHEVLLIPFSRTIKEMEILCYRKMVHEVNETQLQPDEWLSDNIYVYKYKEDTIQMK